MKLKFGSAIGRLKRLPWRVLLPAVLLVFGGLLVALALVADTIGVGTRAGLGDRQMILLRVGGVSMLVGLGLAMPGGWQLVGKARQHLSRHPLVSIFLVAFFVRILCMVVLQSWRLPNHWSFGYEIGYLGASIAEGHGFSFFGTPTSKFPPVYPLLVGAAFATLGKYSSAAAVALLLFQSVCAAVTAVCLVIVGSHFFGRNVGIIAGLIWAVYPSSIINSVVRIWYSELSIMLVFLLIVIAISSKQPSLILGAVCLGGLSGLLVVVDPTMMVYSALLFLWVLYKCKLTRGRIKLAAVWIVTATVVVTPWLVRNLLVLSTPSVVKSNFGMELFFGNNPYSTGGEIGHERLQAEAALNQNEIAYYKNKSQKAYHDYLGKKALEWIRMHPLEFVQLSAKRLWHFWGKFPSSGPDIWNPYSTAQLFWYVPVVLLMLTGCWYSVRRRWRFLPIWLFLLVYPIPYYVTHVQWYRYRYPVEPFLVLLAAIPVTIWGVHASK